VSIVEVAKLAGVSHATVSRVINHRSDVSPASAQRVREAMRQLRYVPAAKRRGPKPKASGVRTGNIGILFFSENPTLATSPVVALVLHAVQEELASNGFNLVLGHIKAEHGLPPSVVQGQVDGILLHGMPPAAEIQQQLSRYSACVWLLSQRRQRGYWGDRVSPDNNAIGSLACRHLIDRGHTRVASIHCDPTHLGFVARAQSFESTAREAGVFCKTIIDASHGQAVSDTSPIDTSHYDAMVDDLLATDGGMPSGLFIPRDALTIRMYRALRARHIEPGRDIEIISCDNLPVLDGLDPRPATIDVRPADIGRRAVEQLLWRIHQQDAPMSVTSMIEPQLVPGDPVAMDPAPADDASSAPDEPVSII